MRALKSPFKNIGAGLAAYQALPLRNPSTTPVLFREIKISDIPQIQCWPMDGGAFITLPQVYSENPSKTGIMNANLGMYRIQISGNDYIQDSELGLHYQIHRGIGVHQTMARDIGQPLKVSIFIGGPPSHTVSAVMPLPEGMSEMTFAGLLGGRRFRYVYRDGYCISTEADFVITGEVIHHELKPEGPFGDHLGYYSLTHNFPILRVHKVYAKEKAIYPFTVVGRPPQEDTSFGQLIHELTGSAIQNEIPGLKEVHAVDAAGVHPLLLAIGSERYTPFQEQQYPQELLTIANHVLGSGQLSLAKYLFITAGAEGDVDTHDIENFFTYILERIDLKRDIHFQTKTTIDTLDYSGTGLNSGSKVIFAAYGNPKRVLSTKVPNSLKAWNAQYIIPGVLVVPMPPFENYEQAEREMARFENNMDGVDLEGTMMLVITEDAEYLKENLKNFVWVTFTRSNPSHDIYGIRSSILFKHWGCEGPVIIDARRKPHHAPPLIPDVGAQASAELKLKNVGLL